MGVLFQALVFLALHLLNGHLAFWPLLNLVLVAVFLALAALKERSLWLVCGWHAGWNWCQSNVLGIPVSGIQVGNSLFLLQASSEASTVLTGGLFGVEGSVLTSMYLLLGSVSMYFALRQAPETKRSNRAGVPTERRFRVASEAVIIFCTHAERMCSNRSFVAFRAPTIALPLNLGASIGLICDTA